MGLEKTSFQTVTIRELSLNRMNIFSVESVKEPHSDMESTFERRKNTIFNRFRAHLFPSGSAWENKRDPSAVLASVRYYFIDLIYEDLDPALLVHTSGSIWINYFLAPEDASYKEGPITEKKISQRAPKKASLILETDENVSKLSE